MGERPAVDLEARQVGLNTIRSHLDRAGFVGDVGHHLKRYPQATVARERKAVPSQVEQLLHVSRIQNRKVGVEEGHLTIIGQRGALTGRVIAGHGQDATVLPNAGEVRMLERIAGAVDARSLAVPYPQHAIVLGAGKESDHLTAEDRRCCQVFIDARDKIDVIVLEQVRQTLQGQVKAAEWRAAIAGDKGGCPQASTSIRTMLVHGQPHQRLDTAEVDLTLFLKIFIHQRKIGPPTHSSSALQERLYDYWPRLLSSPYH